MAEFNIPRAHSNDWYDDLSQVQAGYFYPWRSKVGSGDGEKAFMDFLFRHVKKTDTVLEVGCGHGSLAKVVAKSCQNVIAFDRIQAYIDLAIKAQLELQIQNVEFICHDGYQYAGEANDDQATPRLPAEDNSVDLIIGRRAPLHWLEDAVRVCKSGAKIIFLAPMEEPIPGWSSKLPPKLHYENSGRHTGSGSIHQSVENRLHQAGLRLHSGWSYDVPELFNDPQSFYNMLTWGLPESETPSYEDVETKIQHIFDNHSINGDLELRHCRYLWYAVVP